MELFLDGLGRMFLQFEVIQRQDNKYAVVIFATGCAIVGVLFVLADLALFKVRGESLLDIKHGAKNTLIFGLFWALGALIIGFVGQFANIFQVSLPSCAVVGVAWPVVFTQLLEKAKKKEENQKPSNEA